MSARLRCGRMTPWSAPPGISTKARKSAQSQRPESGVGNQQGSRRACPIAEEISQQPPSSVPVVEQRGSIPYRVEERRQPIQADHAVDAGGQQRSGDEQQQYLADAEQHPVAEETGAARDNRSLRRAQSLPQPHQPAGAVPPAPRPSHKETSLSPRLRERPKGCNRPDAENT